MEYGNDLPIKFISIGNCCAVKHHIDIWHKNKPATNLFDWVLSSFDSIIEILQTGSSIFDIKNWNVFGTWNNGHGKLTKRLRVQGIDYFESIHDMTITDGDFSIVADRYKRRLNRFFKLLKKTYPIVFVHFTDVGNSPSSQQVENLLQCIDTIAGHDMHQILVTYHKPHNQVQRQPVNLHNDRITVINFTDFPVGKHNIQWRYDGYDWQHVLDSMAIKINMMFLHVGRTCNSMGE